jgi:hypothetical protein
MFTSTNVWQQSGALQQRAVLPTHDQQPAAQHMIMQM